MMRTFASGFGLLIAICLSVLPYINGCAEPALPRSDLSGRIPVVRVLVIEKRDRVQLSADNPPIVTTASNASRKRLNLPANVPVTLSLDSSGKWKCGDATLGSGELRIDPASEGGVKVEGLAYRGKLRFVPTTAGRFDVVNDVDLDGYLKGVVAKELPRLWDEETYKAQSIVARTYAIYEWRTAGTGRHFDLYADQRSQVYGGISAESEKSRSAVDATSGIVVAYGPTGQEKVFKAYFSSCCGGISQSAADAFEDEPSEPLSEQSVGTLCSASPNFIWPTVTVSKYELTKRFRQFGFLRNRPEKDMGTVAKIEVVGVNKFGRPVKFTVTDVAGKKFTWTGEEIRWAVNTNATDTTRLKSSLFRLDNQPKEIRFTDGHGLGHGVGMCQFCSEARARAGMRHEDIVIAAYPHAKLLHAY